MNVITMPPGGQTTDESMLAKWHKKVGDKIERGDVLFEIETDKAILEVESFCEGYLRAIFFEEEEMVATGEIVAYIGEKDEPIPDKDAPQTANAENSSQEDADTEDEYQPINKSEEAKPAPEVKEDIPDSGKVMASPKAKQLAREQEIDLTEVSSATGIIKVSDVEAYMEAKCEDQADTYKIPTSNMRKVIARRMCESVYGAPHFNVSMDIDMGACIKLRSKINTYLGGEVKITYNDLIAKCVAKAIEKYPMINAAYGDDEITVYKDVNVGLAVGLENGLVVPVVKAVNRKTLSAIARENKENIVKAQSGKLKSEEMKGGTITISNLGMYGVDNFTAIINQPESCILAVGGIMEKAVSVNHEIVSRDMMTITASFDHRIIDGALGAQFLREVKILLENPEFLIV